MFKRDLPGAVLKSNINQSGRTTVLVLLWEAKNEHMICDNNNLTVSL
jgi:hypothetical protein